MDVITFEKNAFLTLIKKIDEIYKELQRLQDPASEREGLEPSDHTGLNSTNLINLTSYAPKIGLLVCLNYFSVFFFDTVHISLIPSDFICV